MSGSTVRGYGIHALSLVGSVALLFSGAPVAALLLLGLAAGMCAFTRALR